ncbi:hypothetical protein [Sciscionella sediminilitoris]|uniref:hypothetical protein n=1 Tax=Sciscionella sediminilitoris TaxID=1445613 RepID=UPI0012E1B36B|nr:hypothetical protein [Sciscionella sp. SE31]
MRPVARPQFGQQPADLGIVVSASDRGEHLAFPRRELLEDAGIGALSADDGAQRLRC